MKENNLLLMAFFGLILFSGLVMAHQGEDEADHHDMMVGNMMMGNLGFGMMFFSWATWILVIIALILLVAWLIKQIQEK